ncbi:hypothetical protein [Acinetobacter stercoris]|uniref:Uncharacterized protein n=1 Tax=Acinetobacter stercoris TaxID=2126983 RepID=A0A2U3MWT1_9GAMM|nr:hypothetical protein [Acinetobacter stercoris]SPL69759.1 hypothetical protein KPC_0937 [Acinetobacter stercoris]
MKNNYKVMSIFFCLFLLGGCQKQNTSETDAEQSTPNSPSLMICKEIDKGLQQYIEDWNPEAVIEFNDLVKTCLPKLDKQQRYAWLEASHEVYKNLIDNTSDEAVQYIADQNNPNHPVSTEEMKNNYDNFNDEEKFLVDHLKQLYLHEYNLGADEQDLVRSAQYELDLFSPYLEKADQAYFQQILAEQKNSNGALNRDESLAVDFSTLANWILFWESYIQQNPNSHFDAVAKEKLKQYQSYLYFGLKNTSVFDPHHKNYINPQAYNAIKNLAKNNTPAGQTAKNYVAYILSNQKAWIQIHTKNDDASDSKLEQQYIQDITTKLAITPPQIVEVKANEDSPTEQP